MDGTLEAFGNPPDSQSQHWVPGSRTPVWYRKEAAATYTCVHVHPYGPGVQGMIEVSCKQCNHFFRTEDQDQLEGMAEATGGSGGSPSLPVGVLVGPPAYQWGFWWVPQLTSGGSGGLLEAFGNNTDGQSQH